MIPILLISKSKKDIDAYINAVIKDGDYKKHSIFIIEKDSSVLSIERLREIKGVLKRSGARKLIVIRDFETAKEESQNILLKTLEEDSFKAQFIIVCLDESAILPTINSRCKVVRLNSKSKKSTSSIKVDINKSLAAHFEKTDKIKKKDAIDLINVLTDKYREELITHIAGKESEELTGIIFIIREMLEVRKLIEKNNLNPQMGVDHILMTIFKKEKPRASRS